MKVLIFSIVLFLAIAAGARAYTIDGGGVCSAANCTDTTDALNDNINCYTEVRLTADIANYSSTCIDNPANFSNKILNCQGRTIDGNDTVFTYGIYLNGKSNNTIKDCILTDFSNGIYLSTLNNTLTNNTANSNIDFGILLYSSSNNTLTNNTANSNNNDGIYLSLSNYNTLTNNIANLNTYSGIHLSSSSDYNTLTNNTANSNIYYGIRLSSYSDYNTLTNNTANSNYDGIRLESSSNNNTLTNNTANSNIYYGIHLYLSNYNTLTNNTANSNRNGIDLFYSNYSTLTNNTASSNTFYGIYLSSSNYNTLTNNTALNNNYGIALGYLNKYNTLTNNTANSNNNYGILLSSSSNNTLTNNIANSNNNYGILLSSSSNNTLTNNTASNNGLDFNSYGNSLDNIVVNLDIGFLISFTSKDIGLVNTVAVAGPANYTGIGKYVNITGNSADSWAFINISYTEAELGFVNEATLRLWKWNGSWSGPDSWASPNSVDTANKYVYANITEFSTFAPLGEATCDIDFRISSQIVGSQAFLAFTQGDWMIIRNRIPLIAAGQFLTKISPSFAYGLGIYYPIKVMLRYTDIDLEGNINMQRGAHVLVIENNGTVGGRPVIVISGR